MTQHIEKYNEFPQRPPAEGAAMNPMRVGLLGLGVVGGGTWTVLSRNAEEIARRAGPALK